MATELENLEKLNRLRVMLHDGDAREIVLRAGLTTAMVGELIGVTQPNAWSYINGKQFPRRATALRLSRLLAKLAAMPRA